MTIFTAFKACFGLLFSRGSKVFLLFTVLFLLLIRYEHVQAAFTPSCPIVSGNFQGLANGTTSASGWSVDASGVPSTAVYFAVKSNRFHAEDLGGVGIWKSSVFSVAGYASFQVATKITAEGDQNSTEYVRVYYKINGGTETLLSERTGNFGTIDFVSPVLTGTNVQLIVKIYNYNNGGSQTSKYYVEDYRVFKEAGPCAGSISVTASANRTTLTCTNTTATLTASSSESGVTYSWTGPNSFTSTSQSPVVSTAGVYTVTATSANGTGSASVTITENKTPPDVTATGGSLACASSVTLSASSSVSGVTYSWTGPNSFTSTSRTPVVSTAGTYTVTVTNPANGCTSSTTAVVTTTSSGTASAFWIEDFTLSNGTTSDTGATSWSISNAGSGTFSVQSNEFMASFSSANEGVWSSGVVDISSKSNVVISVDLRSGTASSGDNLETTDYIQVYYKLNGGAETLVYGDVAGLNGVDNGTSSLSVSSGSLNGSTLQIVIRVKNSDVTERYYFDNVKMTGTSSATSLTVSAAASGTISCSATSATLTATASASGATYSWTGPNSFTSTAQSPVVTAGGTYTVTASLNGCTATASVVVSENKTAPDLTAAGGSLTCSSSVTITASSSVSGATYSWTGPNSFTSTQQNPSVSAAGTYTVTVRNPANGCTTSQFVTVTAAGSGTLWLEDFTLSNGATSDTGTTSWTTQNGGSSTFSVSSNEFRVSGIGTASEGIWTSGQIDISGQANVTISANVRSSGATMNSSGTYLDYLRVYYVLNSGSEILFSEQLGSINNNSTTNTTISTGSLTGTTLKIIVKARASGTDEFYYFDNIKVTGTPISSSLTVTSAASGTITCSTASVTLSATASVSGVTYSWTGPNGFSSVQQNPVVTAAGQYTVTASTGTCAALSTVTVSENKTAPSLTASGANLLCSATSVTITASSSTSGVTYQWTGPGGFTSTQQNPTVSTPGTYSVTAKDPANGCTTTQSVEVTASSGSSTATTLWLEDFTFANGTTSDTGTTSWSISNPGSGTFSVQNNEFMASFSAANEGVWQSGVVSIEGKSDVVISVDLKSGTAGSGDYLESDDYIRVYYKLNGGAETLIYGDAAGLNGIDNGTATLAVSSSSLTGSTVQVVIRARNSSTTERYYFDNVKITGKDSPIGVINVAAGGSLSCTNPSVQLTASVAASGATYYWIDPNGTIINSQNPIVSVAGNYTVIVTANGCKGSASLLVSGSVTVPDISIIGNNLSCTAGSTAVLTAYSSVSGLTYRWTGPGSFSSTVANPTVTAPGAYTVTVTNSTNQCTASASFTVGYSAGVTTPVWNETFDELSDGTTIDNGATAWSVDNSKIHTVDLSHYSDETGTPYYFETRSGKLTAKTTRGEVKWTSQLIDIAALGQVQVKVDITGEGSLNDDTDCGSDCFDYDYVKMFYRLNGGVEIPFTTNGSFPGKLALDGLVASTGIVSGNTLQIILVAYNTGNNEIFYFDNIRVLKVEPVTAGTVSASVSGKITCANPSVTLSATPVESTATYSWTTPESTVITGSTVTVSKAGTYSLAVSGGGGCLSGSTATVVVEADKAAPVVSVNTPAVLTCAVTSATLQASASPASGVTYSWLRPDGSTAAASSLTVTTPGSYKVTVTNTANGCSVESTVAVSQNITKPDVTASVSGAISCAANTVTVTASSTTNGVTYSWSGPGNFTSTAASFTTSVAGTYTVIGTNPVNSCTTEKTVAVTGDVTVPANVSATASGSLTCTNLSVTLTGSSTTSGVTYRWTGPNGYTSTTQNPVVTVGGAYTLTVTSPSSGCTATASVTVSQNVTPPAVTAGVSGTLTCITTSVTLTATTTVTTGITYSWTGPAGFTSSAKNPVVTATGSYSVTVTDAASGCTSAASGITVSENKTAPGVSIAPVDVLTCTKLSVNLTATSSTTGVQYRWTGPNGYTSSEQAPATTLAGNYTVTVTNPANGCTATASTTVTQNNAQPAGVTASASGMINCVESSVILSGTSSTSGVNYAWSGPNNFTSVQQNPEVDVPGLYHLTVTNPANSCTQTAEVLVEEDSNTPAGVTASASSQLTCAVTTVTLAGSSTTSGVSYNWIGPDGFNSSSQTPSATVAGAYTLIVLNPVNGCSASTGVTVSENKAVPANVSASVSGGLTCAATSVTLQGTSSTANARYHWTGPQGYTSNEQNPVTDVPGAYTLTVTHPESGCTATASATVEQNNGTIPGGVTVASSGELNCATSSVTLTASAGGSGVTYRWTGPNNFTATTASTIVTAPGAYSVTATSDGGCSATSSITVTQNTTAPNANISNTTSNTPILTCYVNPLIYTGTSTTSGATYSWADASGNVLSSSAVISVSVPGNYILTVTGPNGCTTQRNKTVTQNLASPTANASVSGNITCTNASVTLTGTSSGTPVTYSWSGPNGFTSTVQNPVVSVAGDYTLTIRTPGGCTSTKTVSVLENKTAPEGVTASLSEDSNYCLDGYVTLIGTSTTSGVTYHWTSTSGFTSDEQNPLTTLGGTYTLTVTNASNGCVSTTTTWVNNSCD